MSEFEIGETDSDLFHSSYTDSINSKGMILNRPFNKDHTILIDILSNKIKQIFNNQDKELMAISFYKTPSDIKYEMYSEKSIEELLINTNLLEKNYIAHIKIYNTYSCQYYMRLIFTDSEVANLVDKITLSDKHKFDCKSSEYYKNYTLFNRFYDLYKIYEDYMQSKNNIKDENSIVSVVDSKIEDEINIYIDNLKIALNKLVKENKELKENTEKYKKILDIIRK